MHIQHIATKRRLTSSTAREPFLLEKCIAMLWREKLRLPSSQNTELRKNALRRNGEFCGLPRGGVRRREQDGVKLNPAGTSTAPSAAGLCSAGMRTHTCAHALVLDSRDTYDILCPELSNIFLRIHPIGPTILGDKRQTLPFCDSPFRP